MIWVVEYKWVYRRPENPLLSHWPEMTSLIELDAFRFSGVVRSSQTPGPVSQCWGLLHAKICLAFYTGVEIWTYLLMLTEQARLLTKPFLQPKVETLLWLTHKVGFFFFNIKDDKHTIGIKLKFRCLHCNETNFEAFQFMFIKGNKKWVLCKCLRSRDLMPHKSSFQA